MLLRGSFPTRVRCIDHLSRYLSIQNRHHTIVVQVLSSSQDHIRNSKRTTSKTFFIQSNHPDRTFTAIASAGQDVSPEVIASTISPSGKLTAILRETITLGDKKRFVEIWEDERLETSVDVTKAHGTFYTDGEPLALLTSHARILVWLAQQKVLQTSRSALDAGLFPLRDGVGLHCRSERTRE